MEENVSGVQQEVPSVPEIYTITILTSDVPPEAIEELSFENNVPDVMKEQRCYGD